MKRKIPETLTDEITNLIESGEAFKKRQAERARQREATARRMDAIILMNDPLPPDAA